jgi:hypothetical protein
MTGGFVEANNWWWIGGGDTLAGSVLMVDDIGDWRGNEDRLLYMAAPKGKNRP